MKITNFVYKGYSYSDEKLSSWSTYFEYLLWLRNNEILFESNTYFTQNGGFYINNGNSANNYFPEYPFDHFPGIHKNIGEINLTKIDYYAKYLVIYSEEEITKIRNFSVKHLK